MTTGSTSHKVATFGYSSTAVSAFDYFLLFPSFLFWPRETGGLGAYEMTRGDQKDFTANGWKAGRGRPGQPPQFPVSFFLGMFVLLSRTITYVSSTPCPP